MKITTTTREILYRDVYDDENRLVIKGGVFERVISETFLGVGNILTKPAPIVRDFGEIVFEHSEYSYKLIIKKIIRNERDDIAITFGAHHAIPLVGPAKMLLSDDGEGGLSETWKFDFHKKDVFPNKEMYLNYNRYFKPVWIVPYKKRGQRSDNSPYYVFSRENRIYRPPTPNSFNSGALCLGYTTTWPEPGPNSEIEFAVNFMRFFFSNAYNSDLLHGTFDPVFDLRWGRWVGDAMDCDFEPIINEELHNLLSQVV